MNYIKYFKDYNKSIFNLLENIDHLLINKSVKLIKDVKKSNKTIYIMGNGGSSSIASHVSVDFSKIAKIPSLTFSDSNLITCFSNDFGYENWLSKAINIFCDKKDLIILISSSGKSKNIINAAKYCLKNKINFITLTGFEKNNPLSLLSNINFFINSKNYNYIEMSHHIILLSLVDIFTKKNF